MHEIENESLFALKMTLRNLYFLEKQNKKQKTQNQSQIDKQDWHNKQLGYQMEWTKVQRNCWTITATIQTNERGDDKKRQEREREREREREQEQEQHTAYQRQHTSTQQVHNQHITPLTPISHFPLSICSCLFAFVLI